jgi:hypothetical protein
MRQVSIGIVVYLSMLAPQMLRGANEALEVHELELEPAKYVGRVMTVDGRFASAGAGRMRLVGSMIEFRLGPEIHLYANPEHVSVSGRLEGRPGRLVFHVERLQKIPSEAKRFAERRERISQTNFPALYELSEWAGQRAEWYGDEQLSRLSTDAWRAAFQAEADQLVRRRQAEALFALVDRGQTRSLDPAELDRLRYMALVIKASQLDRADDEGRLALARDVQSFLPGATAAVPATQANSATDPPALEAEYANADNATRQKLHRALYCRLVAEALRLRAERPQADLADLAREAGKLTPENRDLVRDLRRLELEERAARLAALSRGEVLRLRGEFEAIDLAERGREIAAGWLRGRRAKLEPSDVEDRLALAKDYRQILGDAATAEALYREALAISPSAEAEQGLLELGLVKANGEWHRASTSPTPRNLDDGGVVAGQSEQLVFARLGSPDAVSRLIGGGWMLEQWSYQGPPQLWVYLRRSTATGQATVVRIVAP